MVTQTGLQSPRASQPFLNPQLHVLFVVSTHPRPSPLCLGPTVLHHSHENTQDAEPCWGFLSFAFEFLITRKVENHPYALNGPFSPGPGGLGLGGPDGSVFVVERSHRDVVAVCKGSVPAT